MYWILLQQTAGSRVGVFTFLVEKLLGVFACQDQLPRNSTKQLDDQGYVVYREAEKCTYTDDETQS